MPMGLENKNFERILTYVKILPARHMQVVVQCLTVWGLTMLMCTGYGNS